MHVKDHAESAQMPPQLKEDIQRLKELRASGHDINRNINNSKEFSNPYLLEKIMRVFSIEGYCSNYDTAVYDYRKYMQMAQEPTGNLARHNKGEERKENNKSETCAAESTRQDAQSGKQRRRMRTQSGWSQ